MKKRFFIGSFLFIFTALNLFSADWYVCVGSFKNPENSKKRCLELNNYNIPTFVGAEKLDNGETLYRVYIDSEFPTKDSAVAFRNEISKKDELKSLGETKFWFKQYTGPKDRYIFIKSGGETVVVEKEVIKEVIKEVPVEVEKIVEKEVIKEVIVEKYINVPAEPEEPEAPPIPEHSEETPFSVLIHSYSDEQSAISAQKRLETKEIDTYIVKEYDENSRFSFNIHSGAFTTQEEAEDLVTQLKEKGITEANITDYFELKDNIEKYEELEANGEIEFEEESDVYPSILTEAVTILLDYFPVNSDYEFEEFHAIDLDNKRELEEPITYSDITNAVSLSPDSIHAVCSAVYKDSLYGGNKAFIYTAIGDENTFVSLDDITGLALTLTIMDYKLDCKISPKKGNYIIQGVSKEQDYVIYIRLDNFTGKDFETYLQKIQSGEEISVYPQLRKTLFILPDENPETDDLFTEFNLTVVNNDK